MANAEQRDREGIQTSIKLRVQYLIVVGSHMLRSAQLTIERLAERFCLIVQIDHHHFGCLSAFVRVVVVRVSSF